MEKKLIELHEEWKKDGVLPNDGLCGNVPPKYKETLMLFDPQDYATYGNYWGAEIPYNIYRKDPNPPRLTRWREYGKLRQTIVLLICAMHGEL